MSTVGEFTLAGAMRWLLAGAFAIAWALAAALPGSAESTSLEVSGVTARGVYAYDPATGEVIVSQNAGERLMIGSVTKVATALVVMDHLSLDDEVTIASTDMVGPGFSAMGLQPGDTLTVEQLLQGLLIVSGGDAAQALARHAGGDISGSDIPREAISAFVDAMNDKAGELGLADTHFANPDGEDDDDAWSTAHDVAHLYAALEANPDLAAISAQTEYTFSSVGPEETPYSGVSTNQLAGTHDVISAKTGSTLEAGGCLVLARGIPGGDGTEIVAILGSTLEYDETWTPTIDERWNDAVTVIETIDREWTPGQFIAEVATEAPVASDADAEAADQPDPQPLAAQPADATSAGSRAEPILVITVATGVLAFAGVFAWSRITHPRF